MATLKKPSRPWDIDDLLRLGTKTGATYLKAVPVLILENWVRGERKEGEANFVKTKDLADRLESSKVGLGFDPRVTGHISGALTKIQRGRNLTDPPLIESEAGGIHRINLPHYESLLEDYRRRYRARYPADYKKLFPEEEPEWERPSLPKKRTEQKEDKPTPSEPDAQDEIYNLLTQLERALRDRQQAIERLTEENQKLRAELVASQEETQELSFVHTSPDFPDTGYGAKVTSIKDTIGAMLQRARHSIRISTRQMDMFEDDLIGLKRSVPDLEITVLSRGPEQAEGPRKRIAGRAYERMKAAGIKLPVERHLLHSRMVVSDDQELLVSSADLDYTQMEKEFNSGIWTNNPDVVAEAIRYFDNLLKSLTVK